MTPNLDFFVTPADLHAALDEADVQVVAVDAPEDFAQAHVPGALQIATADFTATRGQAHGLLPDDDALTAALATAGLRGDAHIVVYDRVGDAQAARLAYTLAAAGHERYSLLDGGLAAWHAAGLPLEAGPPARSAGDFHVARRDQYIADRGWIEARLDSVDAQMLDVRSADEYAGRDVRSARGGHIPGAVHLDWRQFKDDAGQLRPFDEIRTLLAGHGIDESGEITAYCQSHARSAYAWLVLKALGYPRIRGYPGAWSDWGNLDHTPIETGD